MIEANPAVWHIEYWEIGIRIFIALGLGGLIGLERELGGHSAGFRTHILVCIGSTLIVILSIYGFSQFAYEPNVRMDPARLAAQVVAGVGFLGAGTIMRTGTTISGLTTAASLWVVAAIGLSVGAGFYFGAILTAFVTFFSLFLLNKLEKVFSKSRQTKELNIEVWDGNGNIGTIMSTLQELGIRIIKINIENDQTTMVEGSKHAVRMHMIVKLDKSRKNRETLDKLLSLPDVISVATNITEGYDAKKEKEKAGLPSSKSASEDM
ncbi:MAG: MgtC/SapB family protein [Paenibacillaceae bacterium]